MKRGAHFPRIAVWGWSLALASLPCAAEIRLYFYPQYGEFVDRGDIKVEVSPFPGWLDCSVPPVVRNDGATITIIVHKATSAPVQTCPSISVGPLAAGAYLVIARVYEPDGMTFSDQTRTIDVLPLEGRCNGDPTISPQGLIVLPNTSLSAASVRERINRDPAYAARLGNPTAGNDLRIGDYTYLTFGYPPLDDLTVEAARVTESGDFLSVERNGWFCYSPPPGDLVRRVIEFYNTRLDHYFYTADAGEITAIEAGAVGPDWVRTGEGFYADVEPGCKFAIDSPVYRFMGVPGTGPSSHFFTRDRAECYVVNQSGKWSFEGLPFWAAPLSPDGACAAPAFAPLLRIWRPFGDSNHRFTTDPAVVAQMQARGWVAEGPVMCVRAGP